MDNVVDELGVWNKALNATEVDELYNGGAGISNNYINSVDNAKWVSKGHGNTWKVNQDTITKLLSEHI